MKLHSLSLRKPLHNQQGFSLLEALIASTIFASVLLIASSAFKFFMSVGSRPVNSEQVMQETMSSIAYRSSIKGIYHYYLRASAISLEDAKPFFLGSQNGFTGISINTIDFNNQPTRIAVVKRVNSNSNIELVYCEYDNKYTYPAALLDAQCNSPKIMISNIKDVSFDYFGWSSLNALFDIASATSLNDLTNKKKWAKDWSAKTQGILPQYIKITIEYNESRLAYQPTQLWFNIADADPVQFNVNISSNE